MRAREASRAIETTYDRAQLEHGKPLATRVAYQPLYMDLGLAYMRLGRYREAIGAYRYGREIDPRTASLYDLLADAYAAGGEPRRVAATLLEKILLLGATAESLGQIRRVYGEGSCVVEQGSGWIKFNEACPEIQGDLCAADGDLVELLERARLPAPAAQFRLRAEKLECLR